LQTRPRYIIYLQIQLPIGYAHHIIYCERRKTLVRKQPLRGYGIGNLSSSMGYKYAFIPNPNIDTATYITHNGFASGQVYEYIQL
jgi:hypothetical protein